MSKMLPISTLAAHGDSETMLSRLATSHRRRIAAGDTFGGAASTFMACVGDTMMLSLALAPAIAGAALLLGAFGASVL